MDKATAIKISEKYLKKVRKKDIDFSQVWLFGSYAKGNFNEDIDLALVLNDNLVNFKTEVELMTLLSNKETIIEPHIFSDSKFNSDNPIINQIKHFGVVLKRC